MNKFYVIFPTALLIAFTVYYTQVAKPQMEANDRAQAQAAAAEQAAEDARRKVIEKKAQEDARRQQLERQAQDRARAEKARQQHEQQVREVNDDTNRFLKQAADLRDQIAATQKEIADLRNQREQLNRKMFDDAAEVETARITRRNAELEIQRMYNMVAMKVDDSFLTAMPPPPKKTR
jgi:chromosome segregation ATPase